MVEKKEDMQAIKSKLEEMAKIQVEVSYRNIDDSRKVERYLRLPSSKVERYPEKFFRPS